MLALVLGGSASGKSEMAENLLVKLSGDKKLYIATMKPFDEECLKRIDRHREMRKYKGFETLEIYESFHKLEVDESFDSVLVECMSNLLSNEMFSGTVNSNYMENILGGISKLKNNLDTVIIVSNDIFSDGICYDQSTEEYINSLGTLNREIAKMADVVIESVCAIPIFIKGRERVESII